MVFWLYALRLTDSPTSTSTHTDIHINTSALTNTDLPHPTEKQWCSGFITATRAGTNGNGSTETYRHTNKHKNTHRQTATYPTKQGSNGVLVARHPPQEGGSGSTQTGTELRLLVQLFPQLWHLTLQFTHLLCERRCNIFSRCEGQDCSQVRVQGIKMYDCAALYMAHAV